MLANQYKSGWLNSIKQLSIALQLVATILLINGCDDIERGILSPKEKSSFEVVQRQSVDEQTQAEKFAPLLLFDEEQGHSDNCFPMDAGVYYKARLNGNRGRIQNLDKRTITVGLNPPSLPQPPTYYNYQKCQEIFRISNMNGSAGDTSITLIAGRSQTVGDVCATMTDSSIWLTVSTIDGWEMTELHLWAGTQVDMMPRTRKGNPKVGHFPIHAFESPAVTTYTVEIPWSDFSSTMYTAIHVEVLKSNGDGTFQIEGAWADGARIVEKGNWATYSSMGFELVSKIEYITYWWFYGWQDQCDGVSGSHHADWERVIVKIVNNTINRVLFFQHGGWYVRNPGRYDLPFSYHPAVYVGRKNHGSYHWNDYTYDVQTCCYWDDQREPGPWGSSMKLLSWNNLTPLRSDDDAPEWMRYEGEWGSTNLDDGIWSPLIKQYVNDMSNIPGCEGDDGRWCHTSGCWQSDVDSDDTF